MDKTMKVASEVSQQVLEWATESGLETCVDRAAKLKPCPIGEEGACCKVCHMGPCRFAGSKREDVRGVCGANVDVVAARNFLRMAAGGTAAHSDHARDMAFTLLEVARGEVKDFEIKDWKKLFRVAGYLGVAVEGRDRMKVAEDVALKYIEHFTQQKGEMPYFHRAPKKTQERWRKYGIMPRGVDREVVESLHRSSVGVDQDPGSIMSAVAKVGLADGWGGCMISTDITDILFGTPKPLVSKASLGIFLEDHVNLVVHGHEPTLAEMIVAVSSEPELVAYAKSKGAVGINLGGMCCTANEVLMRHGIPTAGGFVNQELGLMTGLIDAITVDVQCIMPALAELSKKFHTKVVTTTYKGRMTGAVHIEYDEHRAKDIARQIVRLAIDNFPNRTKKGSHVTKTSPVIGGFSHEYIEYMQGGSWRGSFRPLNEAIIAGRIRGVVGLAGCDNPRVVATGAHKFLATELIKSDVLVVATGCGAAACGTMGYLTPETAMEMAGPGLREVCEAIGIPPILHVGACVDNSRILTILAAMAEEGGLSDEIAGMPGVGIAPEWMSEKAIAIGVYFAMSGVPVIFGGKSPVSASKEVTRIMTDVWMEQYKGPFHFEESPEKMLELALKYIDGARESLKLRKYEPGRFGTERVLMDMAARRAASFATPHGESV